MVLRGRGLVVHVTSDAATAAYPRWGAYGASKAALDHLERIWAAEPEGTGVRFFGVDPGEMDTAMHAAALPEADRRSLAAPAAVARTMAAMIADDAIPNGARLDSGKLGRGIVRAAPWPRDDRRATRLLHVDPRRGVFADRGIGDLRALLRPHDLLVVSDAATLPASLAGVTAAGFAVEDPPRRRDRRRHLARRPAGRRRWRTRSEERPPPPPLGVGDRLRLGGDLAATITSLDAASPRLVSLVFDRRGTALWGALYPRRAPGAVRAHRAAPRALARCRPLRRAALGGRGAPSRQLRAHLGPAAGSAAARRRHRARDATPPAWSSTGDTAVDRRLPLAERYAVSEETVRAVESARRRGGRVVAVGTTVARALEGAAVAGRGRLVAGEGMTESSSAPGGSRR